MGVDTKIILPHDVRVRDVAQVVGILSGIKPEWEFSSDKTAKWVKVKGVIIEGIPIMPECCRIFTIGDTIRQKNDSIHVLYHFESGDEIDGRLLMPRSTPFWIAVGLRLIQFFGGSIDFNDCDSIDIDKTFKKPRKKNNPSTGKEWDDFQEEKFGLEPLTQKEIDGCKEFTSYK